MTIPILYHFDRSKSMILEIDISNKALEGIISQYDDNGVLYPYIFHSRKFNSIE
jgi:hypothetical protein